jgi:F-type H+/Na+-transporting ATPase subunit beta
MTDVQTQPEATTVATDVVPANGKKAGGATGTILQITGPVVDVQFPADMLPEIYNALEVTRDDGSILTLETQSHLGNDAVRAIAMSTTDGLRRGAPVQDMGGPITVPVGPETLGRILNVVGEPIDEAGPVTATTRYPIHRPAPRFRAARPVSSAVPESARRSSSPS